MSNYTHETLLTQFVEAEAVGMPPSFLTADHEVILFDNAGVGASEEPKLWEEECLDGQQSRIKESGCAGSIQYAVMNLPIFKKQFSTCLVREKPGSSY
jgi:hypothetical protein